MSEHEKDQHSRRFGIGRARFARGTILYDKVAQSYFEYNPEIDSIFVDGQEARFIRADKSRIPKGTMIRRYNGEPVAWLE